MYMTIQNIPPGKVCSKSNHFTHSHDPQVVPNTLVTFWVILFRQTDTDSNHLLNLFNVEDNSVCFSDQYYTAQWESQSGLVSVCCFVKHSAVLLCRFVYLLFRRECLSVTWFLLHILHSVWPNAAVGINE